METTMNYRGKIRYSYDTMRPAALTRFLHRLARFLKALFETRKQNPMGLDNAMSARLYL